MSAKEIDRHRLVQELQAGRMTPEEVAEQAIVTVRTVFRWSIAVHKQGIKGLIHGNRGAISPRKVPAKEAAVIIRIVRETYLDCTAALITEKLGEVHGITRDPKTIARILREAKIWDSPMARGTRTKIIHRAWRERRAHRGELIQFDGSYHDWFEGRGETNEQCLLASIDDATSEVLYAEFAAHEGVLPVMGFWRVYTGIHGLPKAIYVDKFSTYRMHIREARENTDTKTQLQRAMATIGVEVIFANSSQAKGRIERLFKTFQDRLVKELRFRNISSVTEANRFLVRDFLPAFNKKFMVASREQADFHRPVSMRTRHELQEVFVRREERVVQHDFTCSFRAQWYQLLATPRLAIRPKDRVEIREYPDATLGFFVRGKPIRTATIAKRPPRTMRSPVTITLVPHLATH